MEKIINIGNKEVRLSNNVAWTLEYRAQFGRDILPVIMPFIVTMTDGITAVLAETGKGPGEEISQTEIAEALEGRAMDLLLPVFQVEFTDLVVYVLWAMAKAADEKILPPKQWVREFEEFPLDVIVPALIELVLNGFTSSKNLKRLKDLGKTLRELQPSLSMMLSSPDSKED